MRNYSLLLTFFLCQIFIGLKSANAAYVVNSIDYGSISNYFYCVYYHKQAYCPSSTLTMSSSESAINIVTVASKYVPVTSRNPSPFVYLDITIEKWRMPNLRVDLEVCLSYTLTARNRYGESYNCQSPSAVWVNIKSLPSRGWSYVDCCGLDMYSFKELLPSGFMVSGTYTLNVRTLDRAAYKSTTFSIP